ncbi:phosphomannomutase [Camelimonas lactis]|uniref:Phosphomannomutase n=1 Tax=Camelimonas lactis TaxID=659006 RepID=A0A4R2GV66_9HYPH|nr:phosphomannomutase [Camelimonas lactis]TCO14515.1 phosphomannomutase [Camelimonas lactis]
MTSLKFGTSGLRGLVTELLGMPAYAWTRAFCEVMREGGVTGPVMVGRDLRASSPEIAALCIQAIADAGFAPVDCGAVPTPALALAAMAAGAPAVMVTGSHIPEDRNGLKFYRPDGEINKGDEARISAWQARLAITEAPAVTARATAHDALTPYLDRYAAFFGPDALKGMTVGVYQHSSVGRDVMCDVLRAAGATPVPLGRASSFIPVDTEALRPEDNALARQWAGEQKLDAIVSTDGDADRPLVSDASGAFLRGDLVGALTATALGADVIVTPVTSNSALEKLGQFRQVLRTKVGSPYVIAGMAEAKAAGAAIVVGFEANGGVLLGSDVQRGGRSLPALSTRDAMLPILACLDLAARRGRPLAELANEAGFYCALSDRLQNVPQEKTAALIARLDDDDPAFRDAAFASRGGVVARDRRDGLRMTLGDGSTLHLRASGNAPELRVYVEAESGEVVKTLLREVFSALPRSLVRFDAESMW